MKVQLDVLIVEDNDLFLNCNRKYLEQIMNTYQVRITVTSFTHAGENLDSYIKEHNIDVALLDIEVGEKSGISIGKKIVTYHPLASIIFITAHGELIKKANMLCPVGFLDKPIQYSRMERLLYRVIMEKRGAASIEESNAKIVTLKRNREIVEIRECEILYIKTMDRKIQVTLKNDCFYIQNSISGMSEQLSELFVKVSRDIIVNKREVIAIVKGKITMSNEDVLSIPLFKHKEIVQMIRS